MKGTKKIVRGTGKVILALLGGILFPALIWVALGVAVTRGMRIGTPRKALAHTV